MLHKYNYMRNSLKMSFTTLRMSYVHQRLRTFSRSKTIMLTIVAVLILIYLLPFDLSYQLCDPKKQLSWFCRWPDPLATVCSWNDHFPAVKEHVRSPESYEEVLSGLPRARPRFEFSNSTLAKCSEESIDIIIFVISKCSHASIRQSIRRTWGNTRLLQRYFPGTVLKLLFLVDVDSRSGRKVELEHSFHNDLVQVTSLPEQYDYVTDREAALYEFVTERCKQTKFLFKTDDDIFINTFLLLSSKGKFETLTNKTSYSLFGFPIEYGLVVRRAVDEIGERYIITHDEYPCPRYPTFLSGFGYLMSFRTCSLLVKAYRADRQPFPLSDVYFTGLLPQMFNIERQTIFRTVDYRYQTKCSHEFFTAQHNAFACAASNDHFNKQKSSRNGNFMNDYNLYWTKLIEKYDSLRIHDVVGAAAAAV